MVFTDTEIRLEHLQMTIRGHRCQTGTRHRILCLHGWLDNANSFKALLPLLNDSDTVAIDLPGHGLSDHSVEPYTIANNAHYVLQTARQLGWDSFHLVGHSMGGCIAPFAAVADPQSIQSLVLIDAAGPITETAAQLPDRLQQFHRELSKFHTYRSREFDRPEQAVESRLKATRMKHSSAALIIERQLQQTNSGSYQWRFDGKLRVASASYYTEEQVRSVLAGLSCPVQCILAESGYLIDKKQIHDRLASISNLQLKQLPGNHHLHMDTPEIVAVEINRFLSTLNG